MADISKEVKSFRDAVYGEEVRGSMISLAEKINTESTNSATSSRESATQAKAAKAVADTAADNAGKKAALADTAAKKATDVANVVQKKLDNGELKGNQGPEGPRGKEGAAVITSLNPGYFAMSVNSEGHLLMSHNDNEPAPPLAVAAGRLKYTIS